MRRPQRHQRPQPTSPAGARFVGTVVGSGISNSGGGAGHQAAHRVADQHQVGEAGAVVDDGVEQGRERAAVVRDVAAAVVVQPDRGEAEGVGQGRAVVVSAVFGAVAAPLAVVHRRAVEHHQQGAAGVQRRPGRGRRRRRRRERRPEGHRDGQRAAAGLEVVADHAVQRRQQRLALVARRALAEPGPEGRDDDVEAATDRTGDAADAAHAGLDQVADDRHRDDRVLHALHHAEQAAGGLDDQRGQGADVGGVGPAGQRQPSPLLQPVEVFDADPGRGALLEKGHQRGHRQQHRLRRRRR